MKTKIKSKHKIIKILTTLFNNHFSPQDKEATPYLNKYRVNDNAISTEAMKAMGQYLYTEDRFDRNSYDIVIAITR